MDEPSESEQDCNGEDGLSSVRRPMNAFFIFCKRHRDIVREKYPHLENRSITKILGEWWANLDPSEKESYTALAKQYKDAFMKAHPDFKWYKLPTPPARTLVTRPSNCRGFQFQNKNSGSYSITLGKLADDEQLGGLSSLIANSVTASFMTTDCNSSVSNSNTTPMSEKNSEQLLKPPKKRYLVNGEFLSKSDSSPVDSRDFQTQNACSALLELAEICTNSVYQENAANTSDTSNRLCNSKTLNASSISSVTANSKFPLICTDHSDHSLPGSLTYPMLCSLQKTEETVSNLSFSTVNASAKNNLNHRTENINELQDQPLNLCKNKEKTITASHQQLIDHLVDKFLCDSPAPPQNNHYKSVLDPTFCGILKEKSITKSSSNSSGKPTRALFTLSAAIESAVDKAYSKDTVKCQVKDFPLEALSINHVASTNAELEVKLKTENMQDEEEKTLISSEKQLGCFTQDKDITNHSSSNCLNDNKIEPPPEMSPKDTSKPINQSFKSGSNVSGSASEKSTSKFFCKLISPPKKSRMWCNIFMDEQLKKSSFGSDMQSSSSMSSPARRSSQRTCKGRRYQALITEGLLQSSKERKSSSARKPGTTLDKVKAKSNSVADSLSVFSSSKKRVKDSSHRNNNHKSETSDFGKSIFNLEEKIACLPKCNFDQLHQKKKLLVEASTCTTNSHEASLFGVPTSHVNNCSLKTPNDLTSVSSSGRYKTGNFDLEQQIASLPKCDIEMLNKKKKKE